jgi:NitT/TauT family transport system substrate-binding protein
MGMTRAIMIAPESIEHGLGYGDLGKIDAQAKIVKQYAASAADRDPPAAATFYANNHLGKVTLTKAEWDQVRASTKQYDKFLGKS